MSLILTEQSNNLNLNITQSSGLSLSLSSSINIVSGDHYSGSYTINPKVTLQTMSTEDKVMDDDVTINAIHYSAVSNPQGGLTVQIGEI